MKKMIEKIKKTEQNIYLTWESNAPNQNVNDCESSALTTMLERIHVVILGKYILKIQRCTLKVDTSYTNFRIPYSEFSFGSKLDSR